MQRDRRHLLNRFRSVGIARKVVGVGTPGTRSGSSRVAGSNVQNPLPLYTNGRNGACWQNSSARVNAPTRMSGLSPVSSWCRRRATSSWEIGAMACSGTSHPPAAGLESPVDTEAIRCPSIAVYDRLFGMDSCAARALSRGERHVPGSARPSTMRSSRSLRDTNQNQRASRYCKRPRTRGV